MNGIEELEELAPVGRAVHVSSSDLRADQLVLPVGASDDGSVAVTDAKAALVVTLDVTENELGTEAEDGRKRSRSAGGRTAGVMLGTVRL
jgi:hypothetical protein